MWALTLVFILQNGSVFLDTVTVTNERTCLEAVQIIVQEELPLVAFSCGKLQRV